MISHSLPWEHKYCLNALIHYSIFHYFLLHLKNLTLSRDFLEVPFKIKLCNHSILHSYKELTSSTQLKLKLGNVHSNAFNINLIVNISPSNLSCKSIYCNLTATS